jgi:uncharacterized peroxidase-related enzyme
VIELVSTVRATNKKGFTMSRISIPSVENSLDASKPLLAAVHQQLGVVPNLMKLVGHSPAALEGYLSLNGAMGKSSLSTALREQIALAVAEFNGCSYCLSAHDYLGQNVAKITQEEIFAARKGNSSDQTAQAALRFALAVAQSRGKVSNADLADLKSAGFSEAAILEIIATVALNILTNYVNNVAQTDIDFPVVQPL